MIIKVQLIGLVKNTLKSPWERAKDLRKDCSVIGPNTKARTKGAPG